MAGGGDTSRRPKKGAPSRNGRHGVDAPGWGAKFCFSTGAALLWGRGVSFRLPRYLSETGAPAERQKLAPLRQSRGAPVERQNLAPQPGAPTPWRPFRLVAPFFGRLEVPPPPAICRPWATVLSMLRSCPNVIAQSRRCRPSEEVPPLGGGTVHQRRCRPSEEVPPLRGGTAHQVRCRPSEEMPPHRRDAAPQRRCLPSEEMPPLRGNAALRGGAAPQRRCRPLEEMPLSEEVPPLRGGTAPQRRWRP